MMTHSIMTLPYIGFSGKITGTRNHFPERGGELVHLVYLVYLVFLVCLVERTRETRWTHELERLNEQSQGFEGILFPTVSESINSIAARPIPNRIRHQIIGGRLPALNRSLEHLGPETKDEGGSCCYWKRIA